MVRNNHLLTLVLATTILGGVGKPAIGQQENTSARRSEDAQNGRSDLTRTMRIVVVDHYGLPIQGAKVFRNHVYAKEGEIRPQIENEEYLTGANGEAVVALSGKTVDLRLWVAKSKYAPLHAMWAKKFQSDGDDIPKEFTFRLLAGTRIGGIVKNESGEPIQGVKIEVQNAAAQQPLPPRPIPGRRPVPSAWLAEGDDLVTDVNGRWQLDNAPPDKTEYYDPRFGRYVMHADTQPSFLVRLTHPEYTL